MTVQAWVVVKTLCQDPLAPRYGLKVSKETGPAPGTIGGGVRLVVKKLWDARSRCGILSGGNDSLIDHPLLRR